LEAASEEPRTAELKPHDRELELGRDAIFFIHSPTPSRLSFSRRLAFTSAKRPAELAEEEHKTSSGANDLLNMVRVDSGITEGCEAQPATGHGFADWHSNAPVIGQAV